VRVPKRARTAKRPYDGAPAPHGLPNNISSAAESTLFRTIPNGVEQRKSSFSGHSVSPFCLTATDL